MMTWPVRSQCWPVRSQCLLSHAQPHGLEQRLQFPLAQRIDAPLGPHRSQLPTVPISETHFMTDNPDVKLLGCDNELFVVSRRVTK